MKPNAYRPDIDGLRAVAVIGVVLFHAGLGFPGGFVGVDVFFVISGFLITRVIVRDLEAGRFSLADFWVRRIRRIAPAAAAMVLVSLAVGTWVLDPESLKRLGESAVAQALLVANFYFRDQTGYFAPRAELTPLLHTWSLAVEEQFYLFLPLVLLAARRLGRRVLAGLVVLAIGASFALNVWLTPNRVGAAFYLLPPRAWELLVGAWLAVANDRALPPRVAAGLGVAGLLAIAVAIGGYTDQTPFPGWAALLPVLGSAAVIAAGDGGRVANGLLSTRPMAFVGKISYSLYLWHWPVIVFARYVVLEHPAWFRALLVLVSTGLGYLSWRWIEEPLRHGPLIGTRPRAFRFALASAAVVLVGGAGLWLGEGLPGRFGPAWEQTLTDLSWRGGHAPERGAQAVSLGATPTDERGAPDFVLWGDSHAMLLTSIIDDEAKRLGLCGAAYLSSGTLPTPGLIRTNLTEATQQSRLAMKRRVAAKLTGGEAAHVILAARWSNYPPVLAMSDSPNEPLRDDLALATMTEALAGFARDLETCGTTVWIVVQAPENKDGVTARDVFTQQRFPWWNRVPETGTTRSAYRQRQGEVVNALRSIRSSNVRIVDATDGFFDSEGRLLASEKAAHYSDEHHLSRSGAERFMRPAISQMLRHLSRPPTDTTPTRSHEPLAR